LRQADELDVFGSISKVACVELRVSPQINDFERWQVEYLLRYIGEVVGRQIEASKLQLELAAD